MIRKILTGIVSLATLILGGVVFAQTGNIDVMNLPKITQHVTDFAGVLDKDTLAWLNQYAYNYEQNSGHQFVVVLIPDRQGKELFDISLKIFNDNGIGSKQKNDGLLLVIATDEKKIRIVVGYGLEADIPDVFANQIIEQNVRPLITAGDYGGAIRGFYRRAQEAISSGEAKRAASAIVLSPLLIAMNVLGFAVVLGRDIYCAMQQKKMKKKDEGDEVLRSTSKRIRERPRATIFMFGFQFLFIVLPYREYIAGPRIASWIGVFVFSAMTNPQGLRSHRGRTNGGGFGFGGGGFGGGGSSFSGGFSGGGGSSGGGGAGD